MLINEEFCRPDSRMIWSRERKSEVMCIGWRDRYIGFIGTTKRFRFRSCQSREDSESGGSGKPCWFSDEGRTQDLRTGTDYRGVQSSTSVSWRPLKFVEDWIAVEDIFIS